jgi:hypothetical protein
MTLDSKLSISQPPSIYWNSQKRVTKSPSLAPGGRWASLGRQSSIPGCYPTQGFDRIVREGKLVKQPRQDDVSPAARCISPEAELRVGHGPVTS